MARFPWRVVTTISVSACDAVTGNYVMLYTQCPTVGIKLFECERNAAKKWGMEMSDEERHCKTHKSSSNMLIWIARSTVRYCIAMRIMWLKREMLWVSICACMCTSRSVTARNHPRNSDTVPGRRQHPVAPIYTYYTDRWLMLTLNMKCKELTVWQTLLYSTRAQSPHLAGVLIVLKPPTFCQSWWLSRHGVEGWL